MADYDLWCSITKLLGFNGIFSLHHLAEKMKFVEDVYFGHVVECVVYGHRLKYVNVGNDDIFLQCIVKGTVAGKHILSCPGLRPFLALNASLVHASTPRQ